MNILITTLFYNNYNYGGMLQAYALYHKLETMGHSVTELKYDRQKNIKVKLLMRRLMRCADALMHPFLFLKDRRRIADEMVRAKKYGEVFPDDPIKSAFDRFVSQEFRSTKLYYPDTISNLPPYDCYIVGGDQMWNPLWLDSNYFLSFAKKRKIAYSCSIGKDYLTEREKTTLIRWIKTIDYVSVRERDILEWLPKNGVTCELISDPVFLLTADEWLRFGVTDDEKYTINEPYIFAYLLGEDRERREQIKRFACKNGFKIASISHVWRRYNDADDGFAEYAFVDAGPKEFIKLISNASFVMTDSFHGTAFSIIFNKPFYSFSRFKKNDSNALNSRLNSILEEYGMQKNMVDAWEIDNLTIEDCSSERINEIIREKREKAIDFLKRTINC